jgi:hypothetical protein
MRRTHKKGGSATSLPMKYFNSSIVQPVVDAGKDLLKASGDIIRPRIGGKRRVRRTRKTKGGFVPSVMAGFTEAVSKYIVPVALFAGYKLMTRRGKKAKRHTRRK